MVIHSLPLTGTHVEGWTGLLLFGRSSVCLSSRDSTVPFLGLIKSSLVASQRSLDLFYFGMGDMGDVGKGGGHIVG